MKSLKLIYAIAVCIGMQIFTMHAIDHHAFDRLYPMTPATYVVQQCMLSWQHIRVLQGDIKNDEIDGAYFTLIGTLTHLYDVLKDAKPNVLSNDTRDYCIYIVHAMQNEARILEKQEKTLLYQRVLKLLDKIFVLFDD